MKNDMVFLLVAIWPLCLFGEDPAADASKAVETPQVQTAEDRIAELLGRGKDPFGFGYNQNAAGDGGSLIPMNLSEISTSVTLKGIFIFKGQEPCALVQIGNESTRHVVQVGDLIPLPHPERKPGQAASKSNDQQYLLVQGITESAVTVAPKKRPEELITIR